MLPNPVRPWWRRDSGGRSCYPPTFKLRHAVTDLRLVLEAAAANGDVDFSAVMATIVG